jgi:hypothetical protein
MVLVVVALSLLSSVCRAVASDDEYNSEESGSSSSSRAPTGREAAEHLRLSGDLEQLAERQVWSGVEKKFQELEKLGVDLTYADLMHGAYAARALGEMSSAYTRLKRAAKLDSTKEVIDWLYAIDMNYGSVELIATPPRNIALEVESMPFDPDQRIAVEKAVELVGDKGGYTGLLPRGNYVFAGQPFAVQPGLAVRIEVSPKLKKTQGITVSVQSTPTWGGGSSSSAGESSATTGTPPPQ